MEEESLVKSDTYAWNDGRRIVDLLELSKQLQCKHCSSILDLRRTEKEARFGLASVLYVTCQCGAMNDVHTSKKQETTNGSPMYEVNIRASINLLLYGTGASHILSFLSVLDIPIPPLDETSLIIPMTANGDTEGVSGDTGVTSVSSSHPSSSPASASNNSALTFSANPGFPNHSSVHKETSFPVTSSKNYDSLLTARMDTCSDIDLSQNKSSPSQEREDSRNASTKKQHKQLQRSMRKRSSEAGYSDDDFVNPLEWSSSSDESSSSQDSDSTWKGSDYGLEEEEEQEEEEVEEEEEIEEDVNEKPQRQKTRSGGSGKRDPAPATSRECPLCGKCLSTVKGYINHLSIIHGQETPDQEAVLKGQKRTRGRKMTDESIGDPDSQHYYEHLLQMLPIPAELDKNETEIQEEVNDYLIMCPICRKFFVMERWNFVSHMRCKHDINDIQGKKPSTKRQKECRLLQEAIKINPWSHTLHPKPTGGWQAMAAALSVYDKCSTNGLRTKTNRLLDLYFRRQQLRKNRLGTQEQRNMYGKPRKVDEEEKETTDDENRKEINENESGVHDNETISKERKIGAENTGSSEKVETNRSTESGMDSLCTIAMDKRKIAEAEILKQWMIDITQRDPDMPRKKGRKIFDPEEDTKEQFSVCPVCKMKFPQSQVEETLSHVKEHMDAAPNTCLQCSHIASNATDLIHHLRGHIRNRHEERKRQCDICGMVLYGDNMKGHLMKHGVDIGKVYTCSICGYSTYKDSLLKCHYRTHSGEKNYLCDLCPKRYSTSMYLKEHKLNVHERSRKFYCTMCNKSFYSRLRLNKHMNTHTGERPFKCDHCGRGFTSSYNLKTHKRLHTGERPYKCNVCDAAFVQKTSLDCHMKKHGIVPHRRPRSCFSGPDRQDQTLELLNMQNFSQGSADLDEQFFPSFKQEL